VKLNTIVEIKWGDGKVQGSVVKPKKDDGVGFGIPEQVLLKIDGIGRLWVRVCDCKIISK